MVEFDELYRLFHEVHQSEARTTREVDGLVAALDLTPGERVLDLACGWGVHLAELAARKYGPLVGVDAQQAYLARAAKRLGPDTKLVQADVTALNFGADFDAVYCLYNALFAQGDDAPNVLRRVARALKPGGRFLLDTPNRERVAKSGAQQSWQRPSKDLPWLLRESHFDAHTDSQHVTEHYVFPDGRVQTHTFTRRHYTVRELVALFEEAGLHVIKRFGALDLSPYTLDSPRTILVAQKRKGDAA